MIPLVIGIFGSYISGSWHSANMNWALHGFTGFQTAMVFLFLFGWSAYAAEVCATFAPEYHNTRRDTTIALRSAATFTLVVDLLFPLGLGGTTGAPSVATAEGVVYVPAFARLVGSGAARVMLVLLIRTLVRAVISATADRPPALSGIAL